jgi:hypothetical protein
MEDRCRNVVLLYRAEYCLQGNSLLNLKLIQAPSSSFLFSFGVLQLMLPEAPQPYGLLYYPRIGPSKFLHQFRAATPPKQRKLKLYACNLNVSNFRH